MMLAYTIVDATVLDLHLRTLAKTTTSRATKLNQIKNAEEDTKVGCSLLELYCI